MSVPVNFPKPLQVFPCLARQHSSVAPAVRALAEETPVALVYGGSTEAVMMATPADLEDFAIGFSITERLIETPDQVADLSIIHGPDGIELRMWLMHERELVYR